MGHRVRTARIGDTQAALVATTANATTANAATTADAAADAAATGGTPA
ncbi:hypothetical protein ABT158_40865 [Nonomuraea sp. NPDC001636]